MRSMIPVTLLLVTFISPKPATAQQNEKAAARFKAVARLIDPETIAIAHVDLARIDPAGAAKAFVDVMKVRQSSLAAEKFLAALGSVGADLKQAGAKDAYMVVSLNPTARDIPYFLFPLGPEADKKKLIDLLKRHAVSIDRTFWGSGDMANRGMAFSPIDSAVFVGGRSMFERLQKTKKRTPRPDIARAFHAAGESDFRILIVPSDDHRRVVEEIMPQLPPAFGGVPAKTVTRGLMWAALSVRLQTERSLRLIIQSENETAAGRMQTFLVGMLKVLGQSPYLKAVFPQADKLADLLTPRLEDDRLVLTISDSDKNLEAFKQAVTVPIHLQLETVGRRQTFKKLKLIMLAMHNYHDHHGMFPAAASYDAAGKPLLSWRVHILPFLDEDKEKLYKQFHLDEPWDSDHNKKLIARMPAMYRSPLRTFSKPGRTTFLAPLGKGLAFEGRVGLRLKDFSDGSSMTFSFVDADDAHAVVWTKPEDLTVDLENPFAGLVGHFTGGFCAARADGSALFFKSTNPPKTLKAFFTRAGKDVVGVWNVERKTVGKRKTRDKLHEIMVAMHEYHQRHGKFPAAASYDAAGKPLLSWRVHLLPFLGPQDLFNQFHLDEPWDSDHNRKLIARMPDVYSSPKTRLNKPGRTTFLVPVGKGLAFEGRVGIPVLEFLDGLTNTLFLVDADDAHAVIWTKPDDLKVDLEKPFAGLVGHFKGGFWVGMTDGSAHFFKKSISSETMKKLFTRAAND